MTEHFEAAGISNPSDLVLKLEVEGYDKMADLNLLSKTELEDLLVTCHCPHRNKILVTKYIASLKGVF